MYPLSTHPTLTWLISATIAVALVWGGMAALDRWDRWRDK